MLQFRLPTGNVGVAVEDVLANDCVYLPDHGLFVAREPLPVTLADYKQRMAGRRTILEEVRALPDQTLVQAMEKTLHDAQREGPVMLSLACDNAKFVIERDGTVRFQATTNVAKDWFASAGELRLQIGDQKEVKLSRTLDGGWLPIPVITKEKDGLVCRQRSFVAPCDESGTDPARLNRRSVCVVEFAITNTLATSVDASLSLNVLLNSRAKESASLVQCSRGWLVRHEDREVALVAVEPESPLKTAATGGLLSLTGKLPPHQAASLAVYLSAQRTDLQSLPEMAKLRAGTEAYWNAVLAPAMQIATPDPLLNDVIRSSQARCLIAPRNEADCPPAAALIAAMSYAPFESEAHSVIAAWISWATQFRPPQSRLLQPPLQHERLSDDRLHDVRDGLASLDARRALSAHARPGVAAASRAADRASR